MIFFFTWLISNFYKRKKITFWAVFYIIYFGQNMKNKHIWWIDNLKNKLFLPWTAPFSWLRRYRRRGDTIAIFVFHLSYFSLFLLFQIDDNFWWWLGHPYNNSFAVVNGYVLGRKIRFRRALDRNSSIPRNRICCAPARIVYRQLDKLKHEIIINLYIFKWIRYHRINWIYIGIYQNLYWKSITVFE